MFDSKSENRDSTVDAVDSVSEARVRVRLGLASGLWLGSGPAIKTTMGTQSQ